jgi:hypothetical protein
MDIDKREAGRGLDARIAEKLGWKAFKEKRGEWNLCVAVAPEEHFPWERKQKPDPERYTEVNCPDAVKIGFYARTFPEYSTDIAAAWTVFEKLGMPCMIAKSYNGTYGEGPVGYTVNWCGVALCECMEGESCSNGNEVWAETAPLAICRAALMIKAATP